MVKGSRRSSAVSLAVAVALVSLMMTGELGQTALAVTCNAVQLSPCAPAFTSSTAPTKVCCSKLREQQPCLCGYIKNPSLRQYVNSPNAKRVATACHIRYPSC